MTITRDTRFEYCHTVVTFDSSEEIMLASVENYHFPMSYREFPPEESETSEIYKS